MAIDKTLIPPGSPRGCEADARGENEWWQSFFDEDWKRFSFDTVDPERTQKEVDFLADVMGLKKDDRILDLCCGIGRHSLELARRGFTDITGLDYTSEYLNEAISTAKKERLTVQFIQGDMREIPFEAEFDAIYNVFTSFGYFKTNSENEKVITSIARTLKSGGRFFIDTINRDWLIRNFTRNTPNTWHGEEPNYILERNTFDLATSTQHGSWTFITKEGISERKMQLRQYSLHEMIELLTRHGLRFQQALGSIEAEPMTWDHRRMIVLAVKED